VNVVSRLSRIKFVPQLQLFFSICVKNKLKMVRGKDLSVDIRNLVINHRKKGKSLGEIAKIVNKCRATIQKIINNYKRRGNTKTAHRSGRPCVMSNIEVRKIVRNVKANPKSSAVKIAQDLSRERGKPVSSSTVRRALNKNGLHGRVPRKKPYISATNRVKRLNFAKSHLKDLQTSWNNIIFSDESKFEIFGTKNRCKIWRTPNSELLPQNLLSTVKHGGGSLMVWGCMSAAGPGNLVFVESIMNSRDYLQILKNNLTECAEFGSNVALGLSARQRPKAYSEDCQGMAFI
jgi:transposase